MLLTSHYVKLTQDILLTNTLWYTGKKHLDIQLTYQDMQITPLDMQLTNTSWYIDNTIGLIYKIIFMSHFISL